MDYFTHLKKDKRLSPIIRQPLPLLTFRNNIPLRLMASIMSQQLSTKVAQVIYKRFLELFAGEEPQPEQVLAIPDATLRAIGLSNAKVSYIKNVATFCIEHEVTDKMLQELPDNEIVDLLTQIKGVGKWTVEMLLMFSLGREDVFALDDLGIQQGMISVFKLDASDKKKLKARMLKLSQKWSPFRTYACLHLWRHKDGENDPTS